MNYSTFKIHNQGGKPGIFWEKDSAKKDTKKHVTRRNQPFHIRRHPGDDRYVESDLVTLTPEEPPPPPKPAKNFIKHNRGVAGKKSTGQDTLTLTENQLNAILQSVGKIAGGSSDSALKISIDKGRNKNEITIESPRRKDTYDDYVRDKQRPKKKGQKDEPDSIYSFLDEQKENSRRRAKNRRQDADFDDDDDFSQERDNKPSHTKPRKKVVDDYENKTRSRYKYQDEDSDIENIDHDNRQRRNRPMRARDYDDYDIDLDKDYDKYRKERTGKVEKWQRDDRDDSKENEHDRKNSRDRERKDSRDRIEKHVREEHDNVPLDNSQENVSPRDKLGLPIDLSWRHMTKAERYRLTMARQKLVDEEEMRDEARMKELMHKLEPISKPVDKKKSLPSDPASRIRQGRSEHRVATEESTITDGYRRQRRSRSPEERRSRTPDKVKPSEDQLRRAERSPESQHNYEADKGGVSQHHLTMAEKKRVEWERDRAESVQLQKMGDYAPWGRPGAGAPIRTKSGHVVADYKNRQERMEQISETKHVPGSQTPPLPDQPNVPHAMRSSFVLGGMTDVDKLSSMKEEERRLWLAELEKQIEAKKVQDMKIVEVKVEDTWADRFGQTTAPVPLPNQDVPRLEPDRLHSAPDPLNTTDDDSTYIRGQNAPIDPLTLKELEQKRHRDMEHQAAIKAQVEEKQREKQRERERKKAEDLQEEQKLQDERDALQNQFDSEQQKLRQKEQQRQAQVNMLKAAMDEAQAAALQDKYERKVQHLERGGHDTSKLREHLEAKMTPRSEATGDMYVEPSSHIPGLELVTARPALHHPLTATTSGHEPLEAYIENRVLTPSRYRMELRSRSDPLSPRREFGTQTQMGEAAVAIQTVRQQVEHERSDVHIEYRQERGKKVRVISASKDEVEKHIRRKHELQRQEMRKQELVSQRQQYNKSPHEHHHEVLDQREREIAARRKRLEQKRRHGPVRTGSRPQWGHQNSDYRAATKQSERDPFYEQRKQESELRRIKREQKLIAMVEANKAIIPDYQVPPAKRNHSRNQSPFSDVAAEMPHEVRLGRRSKSHSPSRRHVDKDYDYLLVNPAVDSKVSAARGRAEVVRDRSASPAPQTFRVTDNAPASHALHKSPPVPAIKHRTGLPHDSENQTARKGNKYADGDPLGIPVVNGDFIPFTRTVEVLDPAKADDPVPLSREATRITNARKMYHEGQHPHKFGNHQHVYQDNQRMPLITGDVKNPIMNPNMVTDHPTSRQDQILMQLSTLKQSLIQRQRELETFSPTDLEKQDSYM